MPRCYHSDASTGRILARRRSMAREPRHLAPLARAAAFFNDLLRKQRGSPAGRALKSPQRVLMLLGLLLASSGVPMRVLALVLICTYLAGCGAVALPFRATADVARIVPVAGDVVATPWTLQVTPSIHRVTRRGAPLAVSACASADTGAVAFLRERRGLLASAPPRTGVQEPFRRQVGIYGPPAVSDRSAQRLRASGYGSTRRGRTAA